MELDSTQDETNIQMDGQGEEKFMGGHQGSPPSYSSMEAPKYVVSESTAEDPPSSFMAKMKHAQQTSDGKLAMGKNIAFIAIGSVGCSICLGIMMVIPVAMIVIGAIHIKDCPAERLIPIYLIVGGSFSILKTLINFIQRCRNSKEENAEEKNSKTNPVDAILNCFLLAWFIAGNVWIFRTYGEFSTDVEADNYCDGTLYWFAFWVTVSSYIFIGLSCCCVCTGLILAVCCGMLKK